MMRTTARLLLIALTVVGLLLVLDAGPRAPIAAHATQPDVYSVTASSAAMDTRFYVSGSSLDPAPVLNTAVPLASLTAANGPYTQAHAAYVEPPGVSQAATNLNNVPVPYASQADALCSACTKPVVRDADGQVTQEFDGSRVSTGAGRAHAEADQYVAVAQASNGQQSVGPADQATNLYDALIADLYGHAGGLPPAPCTSAPASGLVPGNQVCAATLPEYGVLAQAGASFARTTVTTDAGGTVVDTTANLQNVQLLDGVVDIASIVTGVHSSGDGTAKHTAIQVATTIQGVCIAGDCSHSITADGICHDVAQACTEDPINDALRNAGFNVCRLNTASGQSGTTATGEAEGVVVEWHAKSDGGSNYAPDPTYYKTYGTACESASPTPHAGFYGLSEYAVLGESTAQESTDLAPACTACTAVTGTGPTVIPGQPPVPPIPGSSTTTITNNVAVPGPPTTRLVAGPAGATGIVGLKDRRGLLLAVFGLLELIMLSNLTAMAMARRASS